MKYQKLVVLSSFILFFCGCAATSGQTQHRRPTGFWTNKEAVVQVAHFYSELAIDDNGMAILDANGKLTTAQTAELGTGVVVDTNGLVITNNHVTTYKPIQLAPGLSVPAELLAAPPPPDVFMVCAITATTRDCRKAEVLATDKTNDLALLHTDHHFSRAVEFVDDGELVSGDEIYFWGSVFDFLPPSPFFGHYTGHLKPPYFTGSKIFPKESLPFLLMDLTIVNASSGSPVFNEEGKCLGLAKGFYPAVPGPRPLGIIIPSTTVMRFKKENPYPQPKK